MGLSRRKLLQSSVAVALSALAPVRWAARASAAPAQSGGSTSWFSRSSYVPLVGSTFSLTTSSTQASLTLTAIGDLTAQPGKARTGTDGQFSLLFTGPSTVAEGSWPVRHAVLGNATLFVAPVGRKASPQTYEVVVNRLS